MAGHNIAGYALEAAVFGLPEPRTNWKSLRPGPGWGSLANGTGSGQIPLMAEVAALRYAKSGHELDACVARLDEYHAICRRQWCGPEPDRSLVYAIWIVLCWAAVVEIGRDRGLNSLVQKYLWLIEEDLQRSLLMSATLRDPYLAPNPKADRTVYRDLERTLREAVGKRIVCRAGTRSWSHGYHVEDAYHDLIRAVMDGGAIRNPGTPGDHDGYGWTYRTARKLLPVFHGVYSQARHLDLDDLILESQVWAPARCPVQYLGWEDGSRLFVMGMDEAEPVDDDTNNNTCGVLLYGVLDGRLVFVPEWPNPVDGDDRIRQTPVFADADGSPETGWSVVHSHIGRERFGTHWITRVGAKPDGLLFHLKCEAGGEWTVEWPVGGGEPETPEVPEPKPPKEKPSWIEKMGL